MTTFAGLIGRAGRGNRGGRPCAPAPFDQAQGGPSAACGGNSPTVGSGGMTTRFGRILPSFGNSIAVCADHSCRQGIRRRMPGGGIEANRSRLPYLGRAEATLICANSSVFERVFTINKEITYTRILFCCNRID